ncbi:MAG: ATP-binding protein [Victivallaceae bacterium]|nr:ATP-binding protein [Victivallaceae bacterium]
MSTIFILSAIIVFLLIIVVLLYSRIVILDRIERGLLKGVAKERGATTEMLRITREIIASPEREKTFFPTFIKFAVRTMRVQGGAILLCGEDGHLYGCVVSGSLPPIHDVPQELGKELSADDAKHSDFIRGQKTKLTASALEKACENKGFILFDKQSPPWFPPSFSVTAPHSIVVPIRHRNSIYGCIVMAGKSSGFINSDGYFLIRLAEMISLELEVIKSARFRQEYELRLQEAREEGMAQVSTGIIHNIGNAITIAKLTILGLREKMNLGGEDRPERLIGREMLPQMMQHLKNGTIQQFLSSDPSGRQYLDVIRELMECQEHISAEGLSMINSISAKLHHISEIIELQQRFMGELGTENMVQLGNILDASVVIFEESFNKRNVTISQDINRELPEVLIDSSVIMQVFINIFKNAVEAISEENSPNKKYNIFLSAKKALLEGKNYVVIAIRDNGPGVPDEIKKKIFDFGFSTKKNDGRASHGVGLHFCVNSVAKYGGRMELDSKQGEGAEFRVILPLPDTKEGLPGVA